MENNKKTHNNKTAHVGREDVRREAAEKKRLKEAEKLRENDVEKAYEYANRVNDIMSPLATLEKYAKASGDYDGSEDEEWSVEDSVDGVDGARQLHDIAQAVYDDPEVVLTEQQEYIVNYVTTDAQRVAAKSAVNFDEMKKDTVNGEESSYSFEGAVIHVIDQQRADIKALTSKADKTTQEEETLKRLTAELADLNGFAEDQKNGAPRNTNAMRDYLAAFEEKARLATSGRKLSLEQVRHLQDSADKVESQHERNMRDANVYRILSEHYFFEEGDTQSTPAPDAERGSVSVGEPSSVVVGEKPATAPQNPEQTTEQQETPTATPEQSEDPEIVAAREKLAGLRSELAELMARREKRFVTFDNGAGQARGSGKVKALKERYEEASRNLLLLEKGGFIHDRTIDNTQKVRLLAEYTVAEAKSLDTEILESYATKDSKIGKFIKWYGKRGTVSKVVIGASLSVGAGLLTGGIGTALVSGTMMATGLESRRRKKRAAGDSMVQLDVDELAQQYMNANNFRSTFDAMTSRHDSVFEKRIDTEQNKRGIRVLGSLAAGATIGYAAHHLVPYMDGIFGGDSAHAATSSGEVTPPIIEQPLPSPDIAPNLSFEALNVRPGEGLFQTFQEMGVPSQEWAGLLDKVGSQLVNTGDAYWMPNGDPGWANAGQLSQAAVDILRNAR